MSELESELESVRHQLNEALLALQTCTRIGQSLQHRVTTATEVLGEVPVSADILEKGNAIHNALMILGGEA